MTTQTTAYITKYWETKGILKLQGNIIVKDSYTLLQGLTAVIDYEHITIPEYEHFHSDDYFLTWKEAATYIRERVNMRMAKLQKLLNDLELEP